MSAVQFINPIPVITIDGPGGTGKGTVARALAKKLHWHFLESGALYRVVAFAAQKYHVSLQDETALTNLAKQLDVQFPVVMEEEFCSIVFEGEEVALAIHSENYGQAASILSVLPQVREALLERQRAFLQVPGLVAEGRDMGTIIFPAAPLKIFLDASLDERARRRYRQLKGRGIDGNLAEIFAELKVRDERDRSREIAPLVPAKDALIIDTTYLSVEAVLKQVIEAVLELNGTFINITSV